MTGKEYLKQLENCILALPEDERREALKYYADYFEEAADDAKVIEELGAPEKLAKDIEAKFACVPAKKEKGRSSDEQDSRRNGNFSGVQCFSFKKNLVKRLQLSFGAAEVRIIPGECYAVETRGIMPGDLRCTLADNGTLTIDNTVKVAFWNFWSHGKKCTLRPRILVTVPENAELDSFKVRIGAGMLLARGINLSCKTGFIDVGAGSFSVENVFGGRIGMRCGMGNLEFNGKVTGACSIDCGMGVIKMNIEGSRQDYSYDAKVGLGEITINGDKKSGFGQDFTQERRGNHLSLNCGMGSIRVNIK